MMPVQIACHNVGDVWFVGVLSGLAVFYVISLLIGTK